MLRLPLANRKHLFGYSQVSPIVEFKGDGQYCFTIRPSGIVTKPNQKCARNDVKKLDILSSEFGEWA